MKHWFRASITRDGRKFVAQSLEVDVASHGHSEDAAIENLRQAVESHFAQPNQPGTPQSHRSQTEDCDA